MELFKGCGHQNTKNSYFLYCPISKITIIWVRKDEESVDEVGYEHERMRKVSIGGGCT